MAPSFRQLSPEPRHGQEGRTVARVDRDALGRDGWVLGEFAHSVLVDGVVVVVVVDEVAVERMRASTAQPHPIDHG
ncbi:hypothetical protein CDD81_6196 [Ophiocordyceps australis]|uniref:Uncharacterized protein n=1 Tax=Ophiocordyceps australis TaxID=1399860 RepID=A0A2C5Y8G0_9HYPO|nr:hypothetical protein CDD81_6196 [Ophiocordyceps australis]